MLVKIKKIDKTLPKPEYKTQGACAIDLYARTTITIEPQSIGHIPTNLIIETPVGYMCLLALRSSTPKKKGLHMPHGIGILDQDYCGNSDEAIMQVYNPTTTTVIVERGERVGQACFIRVDKPNFLEVEMMEKEDRGGFGSTD